MRVAMSKLYKYMMDAQATGPEASIALSLAESPRLGSFLEALDPDLELDWSGQSLQGLPALREKVAARLGYDLACGVDDILITAGTAEANLLAISQLVGPEDEMIVDVPGWPQPLLLGEALGARVKKLARREALGWAFDLAELAQLITDKTKLIFICNPNNPTGHLLSEADLKQVIELADRVGAYLLCDEVYRELEWSAVATPRVANLYERGISTGSVSKMFGLQGLRTGWLICRDKAVVFQALAMRASTSEIMNVMGEAIANIALSEPHFEQAKARARADGQHNLDLIDSCIKTTVGLSWQRPQAGLLGFCRLDLPVEADLVAERLLAPPYRTFVIPGSVYGFPRHLRVGAGGGRSEKFEQGLENLAHLMGVLAANGSSGQ